MRNRIKNLLAFVSCRFGLLHLVQRLVYRKQAVVLMYHRVLPSLSGEPSFIQPGMYVTNSTFRRHAVFMKEQFDILPLSALITRFTAGESIDGCCAITFDDGWLDNYTHAFPILQEFQLPATIFLASAFIGTNRVFWPEELSFYLRQPEVKKETSRIKILKEFMREIAAIDNEEAFLDNAVMRLKSWSPGKRGEVLDCLRLACKRRFPERLLMNWDEVREMHNSGLVNFGSHTVNHVILDQVTMETAQEEIVQSRRKIESQLGAPVDFFAYPNGNFNPALQHLMKRSRFKGAVTTQKAWVSHDTEMFAIPRVGMHEDVSGSDARFFARLLLKGF